MQSGWKLLSARIRGSRSLPCGSLWLCDFPLDECLLRLLSLLRPGLDRSCLVLSERFAVCDKNAHSHPERIYFWDAVQPGHALIDAVTVQLCDEYGHSLENLYVKHHIDGVCKSHRDTERKRDIDSECNANAESSGVCVDVGQPHIHRVQFPVTLLLTIVFSDRFCHVECHGHRIKQWKCLVVAERVQSYRELAYVVNLCFLRTKRRHNIFSDPDSDADKARIVVAARLAYSQCIAYPLLFCDKVFDPVCHLGFCFGVHAHTNRKPDVPHCVPRQLCRPWRFRITRVAVFECRRYRRICHSGFCRPRHIGASLCCSTPSSPSQKRRPEEVERHRLLCHSECCLAHCWFAISSACDPCAGRDSCYRATGVS